MAHYRKPIATAVLLNTAIFVVETIAGFEANSLSLITDSVHGRALELLPQAARPGNAFQSSPRSPD
jgi:hypothetical protein